MGARGRSMADVTVASAPRVTTPETVIRGSWDVWPVLRDPGTPAAVERGDFDDRLAELHLYARIHEVHAVELACRTRLER